MAGYAPLAWELVAQLGRVDVLVCSVGTGGHSAGMSRTLREFFPHLRLAGVDTVGSTIFGQPARTLLMRGLGSSIHPRNIDYAAFDEVHWVAPGEAVRAARLLADAQYVSGGWSVGTVAVPALIAASAATGFAGALFNPAVRAYLAHDAGQRRIEAFALFNIFYQTGILLGPLLGLALTGIDFRLTCAVAACIFAVLSVLQLRALPQRRGCESGDHRTNSVIMQWRSVLGNCSFVLFSIAMTGSYVLAFQVYLALPLEVLRRTKVFGLSFRVVESCVDVG